jgi:outer membrane immunogenic protein
MHRSSIVWLAAVACVGLVDAASAADMPPKAPIYKAPPVIAMNWTGFYIGANVGGGWGSRSVDYAANDPATAVLFAPGGGGAPPSTSFTSSGALGGLQLGYNWQLNRNWLVGLETDFDWSGLKGSGSSTGIVTGAFPLGPNPFTATADEHIKWFGTVRARLGYLPADNLLAYVTGGFAYGRVERTGSYVSNSATAFGLLPVGGFGLSCAAGATCFAGSSSSVAAGWTAGGGLEYAFWKNLTLKAEYLYVSLDSKSVTETALAVINPGDKPSSFNANYNRTSFNVARVGVNYRF